MLDSSSDFPETVEACKLKIVNNHRTFRNVTNDMKVMCKEHTKQITSIEKNNIENTQIIAHFSKEFSTVSKSLILINRLLICLLVSIIILIGSIIWVSNSHTTSSLAQSEIIELIKVLKFGDNNGTRNK